MFLGATALAAELLQTYQRSRSISSGLVIARADRVSAAQGPGALFSGASRCFVPVGDLRRGRMRMWHRS
jgi:hypothetical protein